MGGVTGEFGGVGGGLDSGESGGVTGELGGAGGVVGSCGSFTVRGMPNMTGRCGGNITGTHGGSVRGRGLGITSLGTGGFGWAGGVTAGESEMGGAGGVVSCGTWTVRGIPNMIGCRGGKIHTGGFEGSEVNGGGLAAGVT